MNSNDGAIVLVNLKVRLFFQGLFCSPGGLRVTYSAWPNLHDTPLTTMQETYVVAVPHDITTRQACPRQLRFNTKGSYFVATKHHRKQELWEKTNITREDPSCQPVLFQPCCKLEITESGKISWWYPQMRSSRSCQQGHVMLSKYMWLIGLHSSCQQQRKPP